MKILSTNWVNILGVFCAVLIYSIISNLLFNTTNSQNALQLILAAFFLVCLYGILCWAFFAVLLIILDLVLIVKHQKNLRFKLLVEWLLISLPFIYWSIKYNEWIFLVGVLTFSLTQLLREKLILRALSK